MNPIQSQLILGGARSGKSRYAETLADQYSKDVLYLATSRALDDEMSARVEKHQLDRPSHWKTIEEPLDLNGVLKREGNVPGRVILVDCLTLWLMNLLEEERDIADEVSGLLEQLPNLKSIVVFVSNEISMGVVPMGQLSRLFVDELGRLHQCLAQKVEAVTLMVAGIPLSVKANE